MVQAGAGTRGGGSILPKDYKYDGKYRKYGEIRRIRRVPNRKFDVFYFFEFEFFEKYSKIWKKYDKKLEQILRTMMENLFRTLIIYIKKI